MLEHVTHPHKSAPPRPSPLALQEVSRSLSRPGNKLLLPPGQAHLLNSANPRQDGTRPSWGGPTPTPRGKIPRLADTCIVDCPSTAEKTPLGAVPERRHHCELPAADELCLNAISPRAESSGRAAGGPRGGAAGIRAERRRLPWVAGPGFILALSNSGESVC